ncbi:MAG: hypothetical protein QW474_00060 [Candidatus Aenigmatarchaeota archaeon]
MSDEKAFLLKLSGVILGGAIVGLYLKSLTEKIRTKKTEEKS